MLNAGTPQPTGTDEITRETTASGVKTERVMLDLLRGALASTKWVYPRPPASQSWGGITSVSKRLSRYPNLHLHNLRGSEPPASQKKTTAGQATSRTPVVIANRIHGPLLAFLRREPGCPDIRRAAFVACMELFS